MLLVILLYFCSHFVFSLIVLLIIEPVDEILVLIMSSADFPKLTFSKNSFRNTIRMSNCLDADQAQHSVGPDLDPNCLQRLSADDTCHSLRLTLPICDDYQILRNWLICFSELAFFR